MATYRYQLSSSQRKRLAQVELREVDAITRRRAYRDAKQTAKQDSARQALRDALWPTPSNP